MGLFLGKFAHQHLGEPLTRRPASGNHDPYQRRSFVAGIARGPEPPRMPPVRTMFDPTVRPAAQLGRARRGRRSRIPARAALRSPSRPPQLRPGRGRRRQLPGPSHPDAPDPRAVDRVRGPARADNGERQCTLVVHRRRVSGSTPPRRTNGAARDAKRSRSPRTNHSTPIFRLASRGIRTSQLAAATPCRPSTEPSVGHPRHPRRPVRVVDAPHATRAGVTPRSASPSRRIPTRSASPAER